MADPSFCEFLEQEVLPAAGLEEAKFWPGVAAIIETLTPVNRELLTLRDKMQQRLDDWHETRGQDFSHAEYVEFLRSIGYLEDEPAPFSIETTNVDPEIASIAGPQLVVPVSNARFALNAVNARVPFKPTNQSLSLRQIAALASGTISLSSRRLFQASMIESSVIDCIHIRLTAKSFFKSTIWSRYRKINSPSRPASQAFTTTSTSFFFSKRFSKLNRVTLFSIG